FSKHPGRLMTLTYHGLAEKKHIKAAIIANNEYDDTGGLGTFKKKSLTAGKLSIYTVNPQGPLESIALLSKLALGSWKNTVGLEFFDVKELKIHTNKSKIRVLLDGEILNLQAPLLFACDPGSLNILIPET